ncbi:MAG: DHA2 family efflux MFS transporter permease subunit [Sulfuricella sp.]
MNASPAAALPLPQGVMRLGATFALAMASFMNILDLTVTNVSVPAISGSLGVSPNQGTWVITSYAVSEAIMLPLSGWLALRFGQLRLFLGATLLFTLVSLLCALSPSFEVLLGMRALQGAVGASMVPLAQAILLSLYPPAKRGFALGIFAMTTVAAPIAGPLAGGWLTGHLSWRWIFLINLPIGLICAALVGTLLAGRETARVKKPVDKVGLALLITGIGALQILLDKGKELDWFGSSFIVTLACISAVALITLVAWELTAEHPVIDLRLFGRRNFTVGVVSLALVSVAFFGVNIVTPLWLQTQMGYTSEWAGRTMAFGGILAVMTGPVVGANIHRLDARAVASFGLVVFAGFAMLNAGFSPDVDFWALALSRLLMGLGLSCLFLPLLTINLSGLSGEQVASASGLASFFRNLGSSFGTSIMTTLWADRTDQFYAQLVEHITPSNSAFNAYLAQLQQLGMSYRAALIYIDRDVVGAQTSFLATQSVMRSSALMALALIPMLWLARGPFTAKSHCEPA